MIWRWLYRQFFYPTAIGDAIQEALWWQTWEDEGRIVDWAWRRLH